jgi:hypothetical protein
MAKQNSYQRFVLKIHSTRLRQNNWELTLSPHEARRNDELISLSESSVLRFIDEINGVENVTEQVKAIKHEIKCLKKDSNSELARNQIRKLYTTLDILQFNPDYICLIVDKLKDYRDACKRGFIINGNKYSRLLGTTGGVKNSTIVFTSEELTPELRRRIENGRDLTKTIVPAKLEAYMALSCSASIPVTQPNGILVVDDVITIFKDNIINLDDTDTLEPEMKVINDFEVSLNTSDGCGIILPSLAEKWANDLNIDYLPAGFCTRDSWEKGMVFTFDAIDFAEKIAHQYIVKDVWGNEHDIRNIELILTSSMLKLWDSYSSINDYIQNCERNGYVFSVTKVTPKELENERNLNYQFIQSFQLSDDDIDELIQPTINEIRDVLGGDYKKSILFLKGNHINESNVRYVEDDYIKALMIDKNMINDPYIRGKIHFMIKKRIDDAKTGNIKVRGNFSIISGDLYALCQHMFGLEVTGLLKANECYNQYWVDKNIKKVALFRAPMTCHNNIRLQNIANTDEIKYWFKYMNTVTILNSWDTTCDALNGADKDGDMVLTTDNKVLINNIRNLPTIMCVQRRAEKKIVTESDLIQANISSFGDDIGTTTNRITAMFEAQSRFEVGSMQYAILDYRIACGQLFQQNAIDKTKGIISKPIPKQWYDRDVNIINENDDEDTISKKELNLSILAEKKPYFMCYIYPQLKSDYDNYIKSNYQSCVRKFGITLDELADKEDKNDDEIKFLSYYNSHYPVGMGNCIINKIAWKLENEFDDILKRFSNEDIFDCSLLKSNVEYRDDIYYDIKCEYQKYKTDLSQLVQEIKKKQISSWDVNTKRIQIKDKFSKSCYELCLDNEVLGNIVLDLCYKTKNSKQFAWDVCGEIFINNILKKNNQTINYLELDESGEVEYCGEKFTLKSMQLGEII